MTDSMSAPSAPRWLNISIWVAQVLLLIAFGGAAFAKLTTPLDQLAQTMSFVNSSPAWLFYFIGTMEALGAVGIILPALTRILPVMTPWAAVGFATIQVLAIGQHAMAGELAMMLPINLTLLALSVFVAWGRFKSAPIAPR